MDADRWQRVEQLCHAALEREQDQQAVFLESACAGDLALRQEVESLLAHRTQAEDFIEAPALEMAAEALAHDKSYRSSEVPRWIGRVLSDYRIVDKVGSGGMGEIYRAVRADGAYEKQVAIKLLQSGLSTDYFLARFVNERQILAGLDHPNIAKLIDGGSTEEGLPYVVMEYIEGQRIDEYCTQHRLDIPERLNLFRTVCSAVQYAHKNLVVHRDLKPGNILVTQEGVPKLLDFGIAKILHPQHEPQEARTVTMLPLLTPDYASPEQVRNEAITTSSDVYSLGVLLYVLLTGHHPYKSERTGSHDLIRAICETEPKKPSTVVAQPQPSDPKNTSPATLSRIARNEQSKRLRRALAGDVDNIVLKVLRKEPERRYASVEQFSEDIRRHLARLPVIAHKDTLRYRAEKFVSRNKLGVGAVAFVIVALLAGLITTLREARIARFERARAEQRFNDVRKLANSLMFEVHDSIRSLPGATQARKLLVTRALEYLDSLSREASGDPSLQRELAAAYDRVGDVLGNTSAADLGDFPGASQSYAKAVAIRESLVTANPTDKELQVELADEYWKLTWVLKDTGDLANALRIMQRDVALIRRITAGRNDTALQDWLAGSYWLTAGVLEANGDFPGALQNYRKAASIREPIATGAGSNLLPRMHFVADYDGIAKMLVETGQIDEALAMSTKALSVIKQLSEANPTNATLREYLAESYDVRARVLEKKGDLAGALSVDRQTWKLFKELADADPSNMLARANVGWSELGIGEVLVQQGHITQAAQHIHEAIAFFTTATGSKELWLATELGQSYSDLGAVYAALGERVSSPAEKARAWREAQSWYQRGLDIWSHRPNGLGTLDSTGHNQADEIRRQLAICEAKLRQLNASTSGQGQ